MVNFLHVTYTATPALLTSSSLTRLLAADLGMQRCHFPRLIPYDIQSFADNMA